MTIEEFSVGDAHRRLASLEVIDVRDHNEFDGPLGHIPGALLVPLAELEKRVDELSTERSLLLVCRSGHRSAKACEWLHAHGLGTAINLAGGMLAWNRAMLPVEITLAADPKAR